MSKLTEYGTHNKLILGHNYGSRDYFEKCVILRHLFPFKYGNSVPMKKTISENFPEKIAIKTPLTKNESYMQQPSWFSIAQE